MTRHKPGYRTGGPGRGQGRHKPPTPSIVIGVRLDPATVALLDDIAEDMAISRNTVVARAISDYIMFSFPR